MRTTILGIALTLFTAALLPAQTPAAWPSTYTRVWKVEIGEGYSSPVLAGSRVFVHSRQDPEEMVTALDAKTGAIVWQNKNAAAFTKNK